MTYPAAVLIIPEFSVPFFSRIIVPLFSLAITFVSLYNVNYHPMKNFIMDQAMKGQSLCSSYREPAAVKTGGKFAIDVANPELWSKDASHPEVRRIPNDIGTRGPTG